MLLKGKCERVFVIFWKKNSIYIFLHTLIFCNLILDTITRIHLIEKIRNQLDDNYAYSISTDSGKPLIWLTIKFRFTYEISQDICSVANN